MTHDLIYRRDPAKRMVRFYGLSVEANLLIGWSLAREWGRIGRPGRAKAEAHPDATLEAIQPSPRHMVFGGKKTGTTTSTKSGNTTLRLRDDGASAKAIALCAGQAPLGASAA